MTKFQPRKGWTNNLLTSCLVVEMMFNANGKKVVRSLPVTKTGWFSASPISVLKYCGRQLNSSVGYCRNLLRRNCAIKSLLKCSKLEWKYFQTCTSLDPLVCYRAHFSLLFRALVRNPYSKPTAHKCFFQPWVKWVKWHYSGWTVCQGHTLFLSCPCMMFKNRTEPI